MKNKKKGLVLILIIFLAIRVNTFAYTQETGKATAYYSHPVTGVIEDPGNNPGIGQGMTENVLHPQALVETTDDGRIFLSVRYNLANYIKNESFAVQNYGEDGFYSVAAEITAQGEETRDYRFEIPSKNVVIRSTFFVGPMGRDVVFYYTITDLVQGNTDFIAMENESLDKNTDEIEEVEPKTGNNVDVNNSMPNMKNLQPVENNVKVGEIIGPQSQGEKIEEKPVNSKFSAGDLGYSHGLLTKDSEIIKKIYYSDENKEEKEENTKLGKITLAFIYALIALVVILTSISLVLAVLSYLYKNKVEEELEEKRSNL